ncbi:fimbrial biogenesis chaperone [Serratia aquatilis]|uniref:Molecular chaperone n=1 Tax=Serratia aquatilis TaxID=1737515 RepID=A0ABV6EHL2_9GAMM
MRKRPLLQRFLVLWGVCLCMNGSAQADTQPSSWQPAGIAFYVLRVIYPESAKQGASLTTYNKSHAPYLIQSRIRPVDPASGNVEMDETGQPLMPLIVTPPLARLEPQGELTLRIRRNGEPLPKDRESVFFISMKAIPARNEHDDARSKVVMAVVSSLKVFYRPKGLSRRAVADVAGQLRFRREGNRLIADNPTPYWLTFSRLKVGATAVDKAQLRLMVPPKGQRQYVLPAGASGPVVWQLIDEDGWDTPEQQRAL